MGQSEPKALVFACRDQDPLGLAFLALLTAGGVATQRVAEDGAAIADAARRLQGHAVFLGGFSKGARLAAAAAIDLSPQGLVLLGYPFHPKGRPQDRSALHTLALVTAPSLVLQGERDAYGNRQAIRQMSDAVTIEWLPDGNHRFIPRAAAGSSQAALIARAAQRALQFMASAD